MKLLTSCFCLSLRTSTKLVCKSFMVRFPFQCLVTSTNTEGLVCFIYFYPCSFFRRTSRTKSDFFIPRGGLPSGLEGARATNGTYLCVDSKCGSAVMLADTIILYAGGGIFIKVPWIY